MKALAIMQPYFFPYIGYFQLLNAVDQFVVYDNIQFIKAGWMRRNRILVNGADSYISLSIKKNSDLSDVRDRFLSDGYMVDNHKLLRRIEGAYKRADYFKSFFPVVEECLLYDEPNLFWFILNSIKCVATYLAIDTPIVISSMVDVDHTLKGQDRVIAICKRLGASTYINPPGGKALYSSDFFSAKGIDLKFLESQEIRYSQQRNDFIPWLSIIDVLMFNSVETGREFLGKYKLS